jgi:hypothetical protein
MPIGSKPKRSAAKKKSWYSFCPGNDKSRHKTRDMKKWFSVSPYPGWITLFLIFLISYFITYHLDRKSYSPESLSALVQKDFSRREAILYVDALTGFFPRNNQDSTASTKVGDYDYFILRNGKPINWNTDKITLTSSITAHPDSFETGKIVLLNHVTWFVRSWPLKTVDSSSAYALTFIPIAYNYAFENKYFRSHFVADEKIPPSTTISNISLPHSIAIKNTKHQPVFYLQFRESVSDLFIPGFGVWLFAILSLLSFFILVHKACLLISRKTKPFYGWLSLFFIILVISFLKLRFGLPDGFNNTAFFSSKLLASGNVIHSFGDLTFLTLFDTWMIVFFLKYAPVNNVIDFKSRGLNIFFHLFNTAFLISILFFVQAGRIYKLVIDSKISFEVSDFSRLSAFTFLGIALLVIITVNFIFILRIVNGA